jgi:hypothetical protein
VVLAPKKYLLYGSCVQHFDLAALTRVSKCLLFTCFPRLLDIEI